MSSLYVTGVDCGPPQSQGYLQTAVDMEIDALEDYVDQQIVPMPGKNSLPPSEAPKTFECQDPQRSGHRTEAGDPRDGNPRAGGSVEMNLGKFTPFKTSCYHYHRPSTSVNLAGKESNNFYDQIINICIDKYV